MEEERREHVAKMKKMEMEMEQVFELKVKEKVQKLKDSEAELHTAQRIRGKTSTRQCFLPDDDNEKKAATASSKTEIFEQKIKKYTKVGTCFYLSSELGIVQHLETISAFGFSSYLVIFCYHIFVLFNSSAKVENEDLKLPLKDWVDMEERSSTEGRRGQEVGGRAWHGTETIAAELSHHDLLIAHRLLRKVQTDAGLIHFSILSSPDLPPSVGGRTRQKERSTHTGWNNACQAEQAGLREKERAEQKKGSPYPFPWQNQWLFFIMSPEFGHAAETLHNGTMDQWAEHEHVVQN
ncbi:hypothetical protein P7K49_029412 [Saguinus oedipus]|uniref:Uncharacterized protein n=1 Tax=Saguinus oedipus TaxID=9490 RepID=A0ABQ9U739_SAGOE|nr:hypothetical protein P7K49_029412 [Saguinus oedipus]